MNGRQKKINLYYLVMIKNTAPYTVENYSFKFKINSNTNKQIKFSYQAIDIRQIRRFTLLKTKIMEIVIKIFD